MICFSANYHWAELTSGVFMLVVIGHLSKTKLNELFYWLLIRVTLVVAFGFCPKILGGGRDLQIILLSFYECRFDDGDTMRWWGHSNPTIC